MSYHPCVKRAFARQFRKLASNRTTLLEAVEFIPMRVVLQWIWKAKQTFCLRAENALGSSVPALESADNDSLAAK